MKSFVLALVAALPVCLPAQVLTSHVIPTRDYTDVQYESAVVTLTPGTGVISAALASHPAGNVRLTLQPGTYLDNIVITAPQQNVIIEGAGPDSTVIQPATNASVLTITATNALGLQYVQMRDLTLKNQTGFTNADGIDIVGPVDQINDWHKFTNLNIQGFRYGVNLTGRTIWTTFDNVHIGASLSNGFNADTAAVINHVVFRDGQINLSQGYGVYWHNTNANVSQSIDFDHVNIEVNGASGTLANCAGFYGSGIGSGSITNGYFESNCTTVPDSLGADIRLTGTYVQTFDVRSSLIWSGTNYGILNDATQTTGSYEGNRFGTNVNIKTATSHQFSSIHVGSNFWGGSLNYSPDSNGATHVETTGPLGVDFTFDGGPMGGISGNTLTIWQTQSAAMIEGGPWTIKNILVGSAAPQSGRLLWLTAYAGNPVTINFSAGGTGQIVGPAWLTSKTIPLGESILLYGDGSNWRWIVPPSAAASGQATLVAGTVTVSTTAACTASATCVYKLSNCGPAGTAIGVPSVGTVTAGTSFVINSLTATNTTATADTSNICWQIN